jgi:hypothetical protein
MSNRNSKVQPSSESGNTAKLPVSGSYLLGRINDFISNDNLSKHKKIVNIWLLTNNREDFPKLPPSICPCEITLANGSRYGAYMDTEFSQDWIEYGNTFAIRRKGRRSWKQEDVVKWEFI